MQEEVEQRVVTLAINCTKLTEQELKKALTKLLQHWKNRQQKGPHGKMTVKQLAAQNRGLQSVEVTDQNIGSFKNGSLIHPYLIFEYLILLYLIVRESPA